MKKISKKLALILTALLLALGTIGSFNDELNNNNEVTTVQAARHHHRRHHKKRHHHTIRVTYVLKNFKHRIGKKTIHVRKGTTVMRGLKRCWKVRETKGFVTSIHGYGQNKSKHIYWTYTVNGKYANKGASQTKLHNHNRITWTRHKIGW